MSDLIMIIEDEPDIVETLTYNLQNNDYSVRSALTGVEGLVELNRPPLPDLLLLDLLLPDISGNEICYIIRQNAQLHDLPIIMLTAKDEEVDRVKGLEQGADDYVVKPFSVRDPNCQRIGLPVYQASGSAGCTQIRQGRLSKIQQHTENRYALCCHSFWRT